MRVVPVLLLAASCAGCAFSPPLTQEERVRQETCRSEVDRVYNAQNRYQLSERSTLDAPLSSYGLPSDTARGLSDRYARDQQIGDCVRHGPSPDAGVPR
jgi:hypothetical protein